MSFDKSDSYYDVLSHILRCNHIVDEKLLTAMKDCSPKDRLPYKNCLEGNFDDSIFINNERSCISILSLAHIIQLIGEICKGKETRIYMLGCLYGYSVEILKNMGYWVMGYEINSLLSESVDEYLLDSIYFGSIMPNEDVLDECNSLVVFEGFSDKKAMEKWSEKIPNSSFIGINKITESTGSLFYKESIKSEYIFKKNLIGVNIKKPEKEVFSL